MGRRYGIEDGMGFSGLMPPRPGSAEAHLERIESRYAALKTAHAALQVQVATLSAERDDWKRRAEVVTGAAIRDGVRVAEDLRERLATAETAMRKAVVALQASSPRGRIGEPEEILRAALGGGVA